MVDTVGPARHLTCARTEPSPVAAASSPEPEAIGRAPLRRPVRVAGRVGDTWQWRWGPSLSLECRLEDDTGAVILVFLGRPAVAGIRAGAHLIADGTIGTHRGRLVMLNPLVTLTCS